MKTVQSPWLIDETEKYTIRIIAPWSDKVTTKDFSTFADYRGSHICEMHWNDGIPKHETALANARLISAAPELLEALEDVWQTVEFKNYPERMRSRVEAAIKKAKGL